MPATGFPKKTTSQSKKTSKRAKRKRSDPLPDLPFTGRWVPVPEEIFVLFHRYGTTGGLVVLKILQRTVGDFASGRPENAQISDAEFLEATNVSDEQLRKIKRRLEEDGVIPALEADANPQNRAYQVNYETLEQIAALGVSPRHVTQPQKPKCSPRTEPMPAALVQLPGSTTLVSIHEACSAAGGHGTECTCPLHHLEPPAAGADPAPEAAENPPEPPTVDKLPQLELGSNPPARHRTRAKPHTVDKPPQPELGTKPRNPAVSAEVRALSLQLLTDVEPLCYDVWEMSPASGPLMELTAAALTTRDAVPFLAKRIQACKGKRGKEMGLLPHLAAAAFNDYQRARYRAFGPPPAIANPKPMPDWFPNSVAAARATLERQDLPADQRTAIREFWGDMLEPLPPRERKR